MHVPNYLLVPEIRLLPIQALLKLGRRQLARPLYFVESLHLHDQPLSAPAATGHASSSVLVLQLLHHILVVVIFWCVVKLLPVNSHHSLLQHGLAGGLLHSDGRDVPSTQLNNLVAFLIYTERLDLVPQSATNPSDS